jgi:hypothetical protein
MKTALTVAAALIAASVMITAPAKAGRCPTPEEIAAALQSAKAYVPVLSERKKHRILHKIQYVQSHLPSLSDQEKQVIGALLSYAKASGYFPGASGGIGGCKSCGHSMGAVAASKGIQK